MQNPAISFSDLPSIDAINLDLITGGEGWGQWIGKYAGATLGGALGYDYGGQFGNWLTGGR